MFATVEARELRKRSADFGTYTAKCEELAAVARRSLSVRDCRFMDSEERIFTARLAEYTSARAEAITAISNQQLVLTFGTATIVGLFTAGALTWGQSIALAIFFSLPPVTWWVLVMWTAEVARMLRAASFCRELSTIINESIPDGRPVTWETWRGQHTITWSYQSVGVAFLLVDLAALACAGVSAADARWHWWWIATLLAVIGVLGFSLSLWLIDKTFAWGGEDPGLPAWLRRLRAAPATSRRS